MRKPTAPIYKSANWTACNEALKRCGSLTIHWPIGDCMQSPQGWFAPEISRDDVPSGKRGRKRPFSDAAIQTCLTMKVLFAMALHQTTGFVESRLRLTGLDWKMPDFSTICRRQRTLAVNIPYRGSKRPLHLLIPSQRQKPPAGQRTAPASRERKRASGMRVSMAPPNGASCARPIAVSTNRRWKSGRSRSLAVRRGMHQCCPNCSTRSRAISTLAA